MRLTCPNCDAQYEVPDEVIPTTGRDVQCSNCGQTWFQHHADHMPDPDDDEAEVDVAAPAPDEEVAPPPPPSGPAQEPQRKKLDPAVADILRQEAEAEQAARRTPKDPDTLETQPDLGLQETDSDDDDDTDRARETRARMARMRGEPEQVSEAVATAAAVGSRRDLLPDIEEINSTLRSTSDRAAGMSDSDVRIEAPTHQRKKRGFRTGFLVILLIAVLLILLYTFAPQLAKSVPAMDAWLTSYVAKVDQGRVWFDGKLQDLLQWLEAAASNSNSS